MAAGVALLGPALACFGRAQRAGTGTAAGSRGTTGTGPAACGALLSALFDGSDDDKGAAMCGRQPGSVCAPSVCGPGTSPLLTVWLPLPLPIVHWAHPQVARTARHRQVLQAARLPCWPWLQAA
jgi:hypothetical protein